MAPFIGCCDWPTDRSWIGRGGDPLRPPNGIAGTAGLTPACACDLPCKLLPSLDVFLSRFRDCGIWLGSASDEFVLVGSANGGLGA